MKKILSLAGALLFASLICISQNAQKPKSDLVLKMNGDELQGKVLEIGDDDVKFAYEGETLTYKIKRQDILKVIYASGRVEFFNKPALSSEKNTSASTSAGGIQDHHNKVAILPFGYIKNSQSASDEMSLKAQNDTYMLLNKHAGGLTVIDPRTTNALLAKAGISRANITGYTMEEIANVLGVEFIVDGTITQNLASNTTTSSYSGNSKGDKDDKKRSNYEYGSTVNRSNYETSVALNIYTDKNTAIFTEQRKALFVQNEGAYDSPLQYLLKRCPLYKK